WLVMLTFFCSPASAESIRSETEALEAFFTGSVPPVELFTTEFLQAVPPAKIKEIASMYHSEIGSWKNSAGASGSYTLCFDRGEAPCRIHLDQTGRIDGFWMGAPKHHHDSVASISTTFRALPGTTAITLTRNQDTILLDHNGDKPLAVGSAFKLYILKALRQGIREGKWSASQTVALNPDWKSLPSGILQDWPIGTPITIETLANLMISRSDNTATDHLLFLVGRETVEKLDPHQNEPFLSTMEMFRLKYLDPIWRTRYLASTEPAHRREVLTAMATLPVLLTEIKEDPIEVQNIEWFMTTRNLCGILRELREDPSLAINPGLVDKDKWYRVAFKGGSEPGVLNYTICLQKAPASPTYCLSATINQPTQPLETKTFDVLILRLIALIEKGEIDKMPASVASDRENSAK
ncbi:MAG TPA: serine hydrolase, partial [Candidatus Ozemobacteraceae bacterium]|nr:serine hydrolase [Candidatus Ozemobacteraceae bacterium]